MAEALAVKLEIRQRSVRIGMQDLQPNAGHQRTRRNEAFVEGRIAFPVLPRDERRLPHIGGELAVPFPMKRASAAAQDVVALCLVRRGFGLATAAIVEGSGVGAHDAPGHEGEIDEPAWRAEEWRRTRINRLDRCGSTRIDSEACTSRVFWFG